MLETVFNILKITAIVAIASIFMLAIINLLNLIQVVVFGNIISEFFALLSMYLPFNAYAVFGALRTATIAILSFLIAKKIFDLTSWSVSAV